MQNPPELLKPHGSQTPKPDLQAKPAEADVSQPAPRPEVPPAASPDSQSPTPLPAESQDASPRPPRVPPVESQDAEKEKHPSTDAHPERPEPGKEANKTGDPPSPEEQNRLIAEIDSIYKTGESKDQADNAALARKLLEDGRKNEADRARRFVLLRRAGEIARDAGEAELLLEAVDAIVAAKFEINPFQVKARFLKQLLVAQERIGQRFAGFSRQRDVREVRGRRGGRRCDRRGPRCVGRGQEGRCPFRSAGTGSRPTRGEGGCPRAYAV